MAYNGSITTTMSPTRGSADTSAFPSSRNHALSSSLASLRSTTSSKHASSHISKTYRQASSLFLTRRLPEALSTVLPLITPPPSDPADGMLLEPPPVARASRNTRIKVWSLYLTILNAITELDPDEGKGAFGSQEWRSLSTKVRDGEIWEEVVQNGYHGVEGDVDSDVVINLATLLLAHSPNQSINQKRLENYLAACAAPTFDFTNRLSQSPRIAPRFSSPARGASGADTPRDLTARVKILELFTLHVLVRNNEWEYAREFIAASPILDEERREAFLQALESLREEHNAEDMRQAEQERIEREQREEVERQAQLEEERARKEREQAEKQAKELARANASSRRELENQTNTNEAGPVSKKGPKHGSKSSRTSRSPSSKSSGTPKGKKSKPASAPSLASRAALILSNVGSAVESVGSSLRTNPLMMLRTLGFIIGILVIFGRKDIRERLARLFGRSWNKVLATAGMGVKVSYI